MIYKNFCGHQISTLGMGCMRLPVTEKGGPIDREKASAMIDEAYKSGINYYDVAFRYHGGEAESFIGEAMAKYPRDSYYLASKMPGHMMYYKDGKLGFQGYLSDFHVDSIAQIFEEQLEKCRTGYFDFYLLHNMCESSYDFYTNEELDVVGYLLEQKKAGRIRHLGLSSHGRADTIDKFLTRYEGVFEFVQIQLNYLDWDLQQAGDKYEAIVKHGLPVVVMEPVRGGKLASLPEKAAAVLKEARPDRTEAEWAFRFLQALPGVHVTLSGMTTMEQLKENIVTYSSEIPWTEGDADAIGEVVSMLASFVPCTGCRYCADECPQKLDIPKLISMYNEYKSDGIGTLSFNLRGMKAEELPSACIGCGVCESVCPQSIGVPALMTEFADAIKG